MSKPQPVRNQALTGNSSEAGEKRQCPGTGRARFAEDPGSNDSLPASVWIVALHGFFVAILTASVNPAAIPAIHMPGKIAPKRNAKTQGY
jgi:hypothetical protein